MLYFIIQRMLQSVLVMLVVAAISFALFSYVGDPIEAMTGEDDPIELKQQLRASLGLDQPIPIQFARFVGNAVQGDFGVSYRARQPVMQLIAERFPATMELVFVASLIALFVGIPAGIYTALRRDSPVSYALQTGSLIGISMPTFLTGILLILVFSVWLKVLPSFGRGETVDIGWWSTGFLTVSGLKSLILPSITLGLFSTTLIMRLVRTEMLEVMRTDYIKFARARGLRDRSINFRHAFKNTLVPVVTITGMQVGSLIAFAIITETVFQWPGLGLLFIQAVGNVDIPVMAAYLVLTALMFVVINLAVDILYFFIDPRLRADRAVASGATT
ncbi:ABC transporter permease [Acuticoccus mangrovi]|uniref:ABC transporter permease n=1 Tax=Acuticoccus mangrovi TaxID=2796142 RepID=A0A934MJY9_9HYPH|nr:ABC transporter permease [Acuticoccus mangrovi]